MYKIIGLWTCINCIPNCCPHIVVVLYFELWLCMGKQMQLEWIYKYDAFWWASFLNCHLVNYMVSGEYEDIYHNPANSYLVLKVKKLRFGNHSHTDNIIFDIIPINNIVPPNAPDMILLVLHYYHYYYYYKYNLFYFFSYLPVCPYLEFIHATVGMYYSVLVQHTWHTVVATLASHCYC